MRKDNKEFQIKLFDQIRYPGIQSNDENNIYMVNEQQSDYNKTINAHQQKIISNEVTECYNFSSYLLDRNKQRFKTVVRIIAFLMKFIKLIRIKSPRRVQNNNDFNRITRSD